MMESKYVKRFDLATEIQNLKSRKPWPKHLTSGLLLKAEDFRLLLIGLEAGARMEQHHNDGRISIQVVEGAIRMKVEEQVQELSAGQILALDRSVPHDVEAVKDAVLLLTIAWPSNAELQGMEHRGYGT